MPSTGQVTQTAQREIQGQESKLKLRPPIITGDNELQRIIEHIYDDINRLNQSVNQSMAANTDHTGKTGDVRCVQDPADPEKSLLQARGINGWHQFGEATQTAFRGQVTKDGKNLKPDYDSGWKDFHAGSYPNNNVSATFAHNLGTQFLQIALFIKNVDVNTGDGSQISSGDVWPVSFNWSSGYMDDESETESGIFLVSKTKNLMSAHAANNVIFHIDNIRSDSNAGITQAAIRAFMWKIPLGK